MNGGGPPAGSRAVGTSSPPRPITHAVRTSSIAAFSRPPVLAAARVEDGKCRDHDDRGASIPPGFGYEGSSSGCRPVASPLWTKTPDSVNYRESPRSVGSQGGIEGRSPSSGDRPSLCPKTRSTWNTEASDATSLDSSQPTRIEEGASRPEAHGSPRPDVDRHGLGRVRRVVRRVPRWASRQRVVRPPARHAGPQGPTGGALRRERRDGRGFREERRRPKPTQLGRCSASSC